MIFSVADNAISINLFAGAELNTSLPNGEKVHVEMETRYPWDKNVTIKIHNAPAKTSLSFRIPAWCHNATLNNESIAVGIHNIIIQTGDIFNIQLPMQAVLYAANPRVEQTNGMVAVKRGPVVYCLESNDIPNQINIDELEIDNQTQFIEEVITEFPYQMIGLKADLARRPMGDSLYYPIENKSLERVQVRLIPYFTWANREEQDMGVWFSRSH